MWKESELTSQCFIARLKIFAIVIWKKQCCRFASKKRLGFCALFIVTNCCKVVSTLRWIIKQQSYWTKSINKCAVILCENYFSMWQITTCHFSSKLSNQLQYLYFPLNIVFHRPHSELELKPLSTHDRLRQSRNPLINVMLDCCDELIDEMKRGIVIQVRKCYDSASMKFD